MPTYVMMMRNDRGGAEQMILGGAAGGADQAAAVAAFDGTLTQQLIVSGQYDLVLVANFGSDAGALGFSLAATAHGQYCEMLRVFDRDEIDRARDLNSAASEPR
jgi:uncharacterized protein with GYD domain